MILMIISWSLTKHGVHLPNCRLFISEDLEEILSKTGNFTSFLHNENDEYRASSVKSLQSSLKPTRSFSSNLPIHEEKILKHTQISHFRNIFVCLPWFASLGFSSVLGFLVFGSSDHLSSSRSQPDAPDVLAAPPRLARPRSPLASKGHESRYCWEGCKAATKPSTVESSHLWLRIQSGCDVSGLVDRGYSRKNRLMMLHDTRSCAMARWLVKIHG